MGLDMYLTKRTYVKRWAHTPKAEQFSVTVKQGGKAFPGIQSKRVSYIEEEVMYWRKANQIHNWFVKNVQDGVDECQASDVSRDQLVALLAVITVVVNNPEQALNYLPPSSGFFFGGTEIDSY
jgi:hypothetical protein